MNGVILTNLRRRTAALLDEYLARGGLLYGIYLGELTVDGRPSAVLHQLEQRFGSRCRWFSDRRELVRAVLEQVPPRLRFERPPATGLAHMRRVVDGSELVLVVNSSAEALDSPFALDTERTSLYELDPVSGDCYRVSATREGRSLRAELALQPRAATVLWSTDDDVPARTRPPAIRVGNAAVPLQLKSAERTAPNVLVVDVCQLALDGDVPEPELVYAANERLWKAHGLETNGWMATIQYRDQILARNHTMLSHSGGRVSYRFALAEDLDPTDIRLGVETPELWRIAVNGTVADVTGGERWLDDHIRLITIGDHLKPGDSEERQARNRQRAAPTTANPPRSVVWVLQRGCCPGQRRGALTAKAGA